MEIINGILKKQYTLLYATAILLFIIRTIFHFLTPLFLGIVFIILATDIYLTFKLKNRAFGLKPFLPYIIIFSFFVFGFLISEVKSSYVVKEIFKGFVLLYLLNSFIRNISYSRHSYADFYKLVLILLGYSFFVVSIAGLVKFVFELSGYNLPDVSFGVSLISDSNSYILTLFVLFIALCSLLFKQQTKKWLYYLSGFLLLFNVLFSFSRRGIILYFISFAILLLVTIFKKLSVELKVILYTSLLYIILFFTGLFLFFIVLGTATKMEVINYVFPDRYEFIKNKTSIYALEYASIFSPENSVERIEQFLWGNISGMQKIDDPDYGSGWGYPAAKTKEVLAENNKLVTAIEVNDSTLLKTPHGRFVYFGEYMLNEGKTYKFSVDCSVEQELYINNLEIEVFGAQNRESVKPAETIFGNKWVTISSVVEGNGVPVQFFVKINCIDSSSLNGNIIFKRPLISNLNKENNSPFVLNEQSLSIIEKTKLYFATFQKKERHKNSFAKKNLSSQYRIYWKTQIQNQRLLDTAINKVAAFEVIEDNILPRGMQVLPALTGKYYHLSMLMQTNNRFPYVQLSKTYPESNNLVDIIELESSITKIDGWDRIEKLVYVENNESNKLTLTFGIEDAQKGDIFLVKDLSWEDELFVPQGMFDYLHIKNGAFEPEHDFIPTRSARWQYAFKLWQNDYSLFNKFFGKGFGYMNNFGNEFYRDPQKLDYPHNSIISSFLYSGIIGGLFYIYFLLLVFWNYWKYRKHHLVYFLMYLVAFFFCMFSGNSHFSIPIFTFLSLVPFLTKYNVEKEDLSSLNVI